MIILPVGVKLMKNAAQFLRKFFGETENNRSVKYISVIKCGLKLYPRTTLCSLLESHSVLFR